MRRLAEIEAENVRLRRLALHDELSGLANRRAFLVRLEEEVARAQRYGGTFSLLLLDLDGLKDINDTFGHQTGDNALRHMAERLAAGARTGDLVARVGGDEFAMIAIHGHPDEGAGFAERIAALTTPASFRDPDTGHEIMLSAAAGIATFTPEYATAREFFGRADQNLNEAKHAGGLMASPVAAGGYVPRGRRSAADDLRALLAMARDVVAVSEPAEMLRRAASEAARLIDVQFAVAGLTGADGRVHYDGYWDSGTWQPYAADFGAGEHLTGWVLCERTGRIVNADDSAPVPAADAPLVSPALAAPIRGGDGSVIGVLVLAGRRVGRPFTEHDLAIVQAFADLAASAVERSRALAASEAARTYLRSLMENASDAILVVDPRTATVIDANRAAEQMTGYSRDELLRLSSAELRAPESQPGPSLGRMAYEAGRPIKIQRRYRRRDGTTYSVEGSAAPVDSPLGPVVMIVLRDMTEREAADAEHEALLATVGRERGLGTGG